MKPSLVVKECVSRKSPQRPGMQQSVIRDNSRKEAQD